MTNSNPEMMRLVRALDAIDETQMSPNSNPVDVEDSLRALATRAIVFVRRIGDRETERAIVEAVRTHAGTISRERNSFRIEQIRQALEKYAAAGTPATGSLLETLRAQVDAVHWAVGMEAHGRASIELTTLENELRTYVRSKRGDDEADAVLPEVFSYRGVARDAQLNARRAALSHALTREIERAKAESQAPEVSPPRRGSVFVIHGHDLGSAHHLALWLEQEWDIHARLMREEAGQGKTLIERLEDAGDEVDYAIAIFTQDDIVVSPATGAMHAQARQNVVGEWFLFAGKIGRSRTCMIVKTGTVLPSDVHGVTRLEFRDNIEEVFDRIRKELRSAGLLSGSK